MSAADRWSRIEELFSALFEMPVEDRRRALEAVEDADLRAEVGALLTTHEQLTAGNGDFLAGLDSARASALLDEAGRPEDPATIGRYRVVRRLARGGMGIVYQAHDPRLDRPVAIKLLPPYQNADPGSVRRLGDEARAASALDNPHIETVYEIGETADERVYIAMAYYEGETLRQRIDHGPMTVAKVIDLGGQLADGLNAAHRNGIVHRDIKPENLLVNKDGVLKIVDFGVAKVMREGMASAGLPLGTAAYMSPEQTRGEALDHRTDLWSAGVVLYEMLTARRPFGGTEEALIHAIRHDPLRPMSDFRRDVPESLAAMVRGCLEKNPEDRLDSADALARALLEAEQSEPEAMAATRGPAAHRLGHRQRTWIAASLGVAALVLAGLLMRSDGQLGTSVASEEAAPGIAVLPFEMRGDGLDIWREGMVDLLSINLEGTAELRGIDSRTVLARWHEAEEEGAPDLERALDVARSTGARYAVIGSVVSNGSDMRLGAQVYSLQDGSILSTLQEEGSPDSVFALVDRLSIGVLAAVWLGEERPRGDVDLTRITTSSLPALKAYLEGENLLRHSDFQGAVVAYERAVAADSTFAFALYHLGMAAGWIGNETLQTESFRRALRNVGRLPERESLLLRATLGYHSLVPDVPTSIGLLREVTLRYPDDVDAWYFLGDSYWHGGEQALATQDESEKAFRKAIELDPGFTPAYVHLVNNAFIHRPDSARAARLIDAYRRLTPNSSGDQENRIAFGLAFGDSMHRAQALASLDTLSPGRLQWVNSGYLDNPRFWGTREVVLDRPRGETPPERLMAVNLFETRLAQGKTRTALAQLGDPLVSPSYRLAGLYAMHSAGLPIPGVDLDDALALPRTDGLENGGPAVLQWFYPGAHAADQERWGDHSATVARLRAGADWLLAEGDSARSRFATGAALALEGQGLWRRGDTVRALELLMQGQRQATWTGSATLEALNATIRRWIGELLLEIDRPREAATYFAGLWHDPWAAEQLGPIYERIGDPVRAREAYAVVATAWRDADPELQPRARAARAAVERLDRMAAK